MRLADYDHMPSVAALMTPFPFSVSPRDPVPRALALMEQHAFHHVPVREDGRVVGLVSERDLRAAPPDRTVGDALCPRPYTVELGAPLAGVLREMARRRIGSAVVVRGGKLAGILTSTDVCRALAEILEDRFQPRGGEAA